MTRMRMLCLEGWIQICTEVEDWTEDINAES